MTDFTNAYRDLLIKQYWDKPNARAEIELVAGKFEAAKNILAQFIDEFDIDNATGHRLDIIGKIVGISRNVPLIIPKIYFGFDENANSRGFGDKFLALEDRAPFKDKFESGYTDLELNDNDYQFFIKAKIAKNGGSAFVVSNERVSIQSVISTLFQGEAYVIDRKNMKLALYVSHAYDVLRLTAIAQLGLLPKPQGVGYEIVQSTIDETFGFSDNPNALGFGDKFDPANVGGVFANKVII